MKKTLFFILFVIFLFQISHADKFKTGDEPVSTSANQRKTTIAVLDFQGEGTDKSGLVALTNIVMSEILKHPQDFELIDRANMEMIMAEQGFQQAVGCTDAQCAVEMGQLLGVQEMIFGNIERLGTLYISTLRKIDVTTGTIVMNITREYSGEMEGLVSVLRSMTAELLDIEVSQEPVSQELLEEVEEEVVGEDVVLDDAVETEQKPTEEKEYLRKWVVFNIANKSSSKFRSLMFNESENVDFISEDNTFTRNTIDQDIFSEFDERMTFNSWSFEFYFIETLGFIYGKESAQRSNETSSESYKFVEKMDYHVLGGKACLYNDNKGFFLKGDILFGDYKVTVGEYDIELEDYFKLAEFDAGLFGFRAEVGYEYLWRFFGLGINCGFKMLIPGELEDNEGEGLYLVEDDGIVITQNSLGAGEDFYRGFTLGLQIKFLYSQRLTRK